MIHTKLYTQTINELSDEIGISKKEIKDLVDTAIINKNIKEINYEDLKQEILTFVVINIFALICKM